MEHFACHPVHSNDRRFDYGAGSLLETLMTTIMNRRILRFVLGLVILIAGPGRAEADWRAQATIVSSMASVLFLTGAILCLKPSPYWQCNKPSQPVQCCNLNGVNCSKAKPYTEFPCAANQVVMCGGGSYIAIKDVACYKATAIVSNVMLSVTSALVAIGLGRSIWQSKSKVNS